MSAIGGLFSTVVNKGAEAFVESEQRKTAEANAKEAEAKTEESKILTQAKAAGETATAFLSENKEVVVIVVLVVGFLALRGK